MTKDLTHFNFFLYVGNETVDEVLRVLLESNMLIGGLIGFILDNTVPGEYDRFTNYRNWYVGRSLKGAFLVII